MLENAREPKSVTASVRVYRQLLVAYPAEFRREYGDLMLQLFRDSCRRATREAGLTGLAALWARTTLDYLKTVIEEYVRGGERMTREKFFKLSGWSLVLGSFLTLFSWVVASRPEYSQYNASSLPIDRYANLTGRPMMVIGLLLVSLGMLGLLGRYGGRAGRYGSVCLGLGALSGLVSAVGVVGLAIKDSDPWWSLFFLGWTVQYLMLTLFGVVCLRRKVMPRWNALPVLSGIWVPVFVLIAILVEIVTDSAWEVPNAVFAAFFLIGLFGMLGLGYLLSSDAQPAGPVAGAA